MKKVLIALLFTIPLFADLFPATTHSTITSIDANIIKIAPPFAQNGISGVIVHTYKDNTNAITSLVVQQNTGVIAKIDKPLMEHSNLPQIATKAVIGDKVIGGYLYNNVLLLAPNQATYDSITSKYQKNWIDPNDFASFISSRHDGVPTKENLALFANTYQVGLVLIVQKDKIVAYDPISEKVVGSETYNASGDAQTPFYSNFKKVKNGLFGGNTDEDYYTIAGQIH